MILTLMLAAVASATANVENTQSHTLQQDFDTASANATSGKCQSAVPEFEALEKNTKIRAGSLPAAAIAVRKGTCLVKIGRPDDGETAIEAGLPVLEKAGNDFVVDVAIGRSALGDAALARWDYAGAARAYQSVLALQQGKNRLPTLVKLARASAFTGGAAPLAYAEEGLKWLSAEPKPDKDSLAAVHMIHARILLNQGRAQDAYIELKQALALSGGLTSHTTLNEVSLRSDLAMAAMQVGRKDDARLYLAYSGAGRIAKSPFASAVSMDPAICGQETGLRPEDIAVVEFSIADNGSVAAAQTVYSRGGQAVAAAFARAVSQWYWRPEDIAAIPPFYRVLTRVELRCSNVLGESPGVNGPIRQRFLEWAKGRFPASTTTTSNLADAVQVAHQYVKDSAGKGDLEGQIAALAWLAYAEPASSQKRVAMADEALVLTGKAAVPQEVVNWIRLVRLGAGEAGSGSPTKAGLYAALALSEDAAVAKDALATNTLRLHATSARRGVQIKEAPALLMTVAQDNRLPEHHPLRQLAWLRLANLTAATGDRTKAQSYFANTGLTAQQCALLGVAPALKRAGVGSEDYPMAALMMGFEGWVRLEFDITADGRTINARPIVAYPPLVFVDAATGMMKDFRYEASYTPDNHLACSANRETIRFVIPR